MVRDIQLGLPAYFRVWFFMFIMVCCPVFVVAQPTTDPFQAEMARRGPVQIQAPSVEAPHLSGPNSYTWILLPDPQTYQKFGRNQPLFQEMIAWIKDQRKNLNIQMVLCVGDLVEQNNILMPDGINGDQTSLEQWRAAAEAFNKLNGLVPYILCTGNHDYGIKSSENRYSQFNSYFPPQGNPLTYRLLVEMAPNAQGVKTLENACYEWRSPVGQKFLIFSLEFAPRKTILAWARDVASRAAYKDYIGVVITHSYLNRDNEFVKERYPMEDACYGGEIIWNEVIRPSGNIRFVFSGHIGDRGQVGYRLDRNMAKKTVHQMAFNAQRDGGDWHGNGGDGWLRILEFCPDRKTVKVYTFSPAFYISPATRHLSWRQESLDRLDLSY
jgi:hypothetical protein